MTATERIPGRGRFLFANGTLLQYIKMNFLGGGPEPMGSREQVTELLHQLEKDLKELEFAYDQYFLGMEKRSPEQQRSKFTKRIRKMVTLYIPQTDLRFRLQSLTSRFNSYSSYWDRIQRLIDEGKYERHTARIQRYAGDQPPAPEPGAASPTADPLDSLYEKLVEAHQSCHLRPPNRDQVAGFLAKQQEAIKQRFGDRQVDFVVITEEGKPKIKVRARN